MGISEKRTQRDYSMSFKLQVVQEVEQTGISLESVSSKYGIQGANRVKRWLKKFGTFDWEHQVPVAMTKTKEQLFLELEQKVKVLEKKEGHIRKTS